MKPRSRIGMFIAGASIAFSAFSVGLYFTFTPVIVLTLLFGAAGVALALAAGARRTAIVTAAFALVPLCQLLAERFLESELLVFLPAAVAIGTGAWALVSFAADRRPRERSAV